MQERANGTGGAVIAAMAALGGAGAGEPGPAGPVLILSGDVPLVGPEAIASLLAAHAEGGAAATMATTILDDPSGYGRVVRERSGAVERVVETKHEGDATQAEREIDEVNTGIFVFERGALEERPRAPRHRQRPGRAVSAADARSAAGRRCERGGHPIEDARVVLGVNDLAALADVRRIAQDMIDERHLRAGVGIVDPAATVIDIDVEIGQDTAIEPFCTLRGTTRIGSGCTVRQSYVSLSWTACSRTASASVPFAYLRPGSVLRTGSKVGTFVEVKNSDIGRGAKVPHLSYIGDADVGEGSNLGAATITANYDGRAKHRSTVGRGVRTGVDTTLVAPVAIGDEAYTGAGSVIDEDVPPGALGDRPRAPVQHRGLRRAQVAMSSPCTRCLHSVLR